MIPTTHPEVFISYASHNEARVLAVARHLEAAGIRLWRDQDGIVGGESYGPAVVRAIKHSKVLLLMCSDASLRSRNVKQEILLAWDHRIPYLPLLLERVSYSEQVEYWLAGWQWVEVLDHPAQTWLPKVLQSLAMVGVQCQPEQLADVGAGDQTVLPVVAPETLAGLQSLASHTDQIWPIPAARARRGVRAQLRDLGEPQDDAQRRFHLGDRVRLVIETDRPGHLLLLDQGTSGKVYCLCPSAFAPNARLATGQNILPQAGARYDAFLVTGRPGRERLLAIVSDDPLDLNWMPTEPKIPARVPSQQDIDGLLTRLQALASDRWVALSTFFEVAL